MHPGLAEIARHHGIPLGERSCASDHLYNGRDIALYYQRCSWDDALNDFQPLPDSDMAHELAHWVVALPVEREFPEYGCALHVVGLGSGKPLPSHLLEREVIESYLSNVLLPEEQEFREFCADFLGVGWCLRLSIPVEERAHPAYKYRDDPEAWRAIIWLRDRGLII